MHLGLDPLIGSNAATSDEAKRPRQTRRSLPIALLRARESVMSKFRPMLNRHDLNEQQWRVIRMLGEHGELDASQLAEKALVLAPSLTRMLKSLKARKLIKQRVDKDDKRRSLISITPEAQRVIGEVTPESAAIYAELESKIGVDQINNLLDMLELLDRELSK
jgi:homoprotocatechuate degradation regulator HpaR